MFRFFNMFGRSAALNALDESLRDYGVHPLLVPDAVKLTMVRLYQREAAAGRGSAAAAHAEAAQLFAYCMLGRDTFIDSNGVRVADRAEYRVEAAIAGGYTLDAKLILLALHSGLIAPEFSERIEVDDL
jgi:hypothetical protein